MIALKLLKLSIKKETKLRKKIFPGKKDIAAEVVNKEAQKIVKKILMLTDRKRIIS